MKPSLLVHKICLSAALVLFISGYVFATNGYFSHGYGIRYKALAGAGIAIPYSSIGAANNPAGLTYLGTRFDAEVSLFAPSRQFTITGNPSGPPAFGLTPGSVESDKPIFFIPAIGANFELGEKSALGVAFYGNGGMNTEYPTPVFYGAEPTGVNLAQMFLNASFARKLAEGHSVGVSLILAYQTFEATGLESFAMFSQDPENLTGTGTDNSFGYGFKVGYMGSLPGGLKFGASYQSRINMGQFENYAGLFAGEGSFDIPSTWTAGLAYEMTNWMFAFDVQQILYSDIPAINNPLSNLTMDGSPLGSAGGAGFGWEDMTVYKLGTEFRGVDKWKFRAGFSTGNQPIPDSEVLFNILAPGVIENHATIGLSRMIGDKNEVTFAMMRGFSKEVTGTNPLDPGQHISLEMDQWEFSLGFRF